MSLATTAWLESASRRCLLVEFRVNKLTSLAVGTDTTSTGIQTLYYGTHGFLTSNSAVYFQPNVANSVSFTESISLDGEISVTYGDVELRNPNGELDAYLDNSEYIWANGAVSIYYGDPAWVCADITAVRNDFELVFEGVISDIDSRTKGTINVKFRDKLQRLNTPITETKIGTYGTWGTGNQTNKDSIVPLIFGEVFNITPILIDPSQLEYTINSGSTEGIIDIRDSGVPINANLVAPDVGTTGKFKLSNPAQGLITLSAQGQKKSVSFIVSRELLEAVYSSTTYNNDLVSIICTIATQYGNTATKLTLEELDPNNLEAFRVGNPYPIGVYITERENTLDICNQLAGSIGSQLFFNRQGKLQLLKLGSPTQDPNTDITESDMVLNSFSITSRSVVRAATKIGYAKNWTIQEELITAIPDSHKTSYATEWLTSTITDTTVKTNYKLDSEPEAKNTNLIRESDATAEATRLNNYFKNPKTVLSFTGTARLIPLKLGQPVTITHRRFGLDQGVDGQVISLTANWMAGTVDVEVIV